MAPLAKSMGLSSKFMSPNTQLITLHACIEIYPVASSGVMNSTLCGPTISCRHGASESQAPVKSKALISRTYARSEEVLVTWEPICKYDYDVLSFSGNMSI